ncbi:MAG: replicative DNA helicase [Balneola sp.]
MTNKDIPPKALSVEEQVLASCLYEQESVAKVATELFERIFYTIANQKIFEAIKYLYHKGVRVDIQTLQSRLEDIGQLDLVGGFYLAELTTKAVSVENLDYYFEILREQYKKREMQLLAFTIREKAISTSIDSYELIDSTQNKVQEISSISHKKQLFGIDERLPSILEEVFKAVDNPEYGMGVPSGFDIDKITNGWQSGELVIIGARPAMGKTAFVLSAALNAAKQGKHIALFSLEMSIASLLKRLLAMEGRIDMQRMVKGSLSDIEMKDLVEAAEKLADYNIKIDDTAGLSLHELISKCKSLEMTESIDLIIIDYLQLMTGPNTYFSRELEIASISRGLKALAKDLNVPVIALSQLSRQVEQRGGSKRPIMSDIRESGSIEQDADIIMFLYRPEYYGIRTNDEGLSTNGIAEVIISKFRNGPTGTVNLNFIDKYARFENLANN